MYTGKQKNKKAFLWEGIFGGLVMVGNLLPQYFFADAPPEKLMARMTSVQAVVKYPLF